MTENKEFQRKWKLGEDLSTYDNLIDPITFDELILTLRCNCKTITPPAITGELLRILDIRMQDMHYLLENNLDEIIEEAQKGREL